MGPFISPFAVAGRGTLALVAMAWFDGISRRNGLARRPWSMFSKPIPGTSLARGQLACAERLCHCSDGFPCDFHPSKPSSSLSLAVERQRDRVAELRRGPPDFRRFVCPFDSAANDESSDQGEGFEAVP